MKQKRYRIPQEADFQELMKRESCYMTNHHFRRMLDNVTPRCRVEAEYTHQWGSIVEIIRDRYGIPACFKVEPYGYTEDNPADWTYDYIPVSEVTLYEPWGAEGCGYGLDYSGDWDEDLKEEAGEEGAEE